MAAERSAALLVVAGNVAEASPYDTTDSGLTDVPLWVESGHRARQCGTMDFKPYDIGVWLDQLDVNGLSDGEASSLASFDPTSDEGLEQIAREWVRPRFEQWDDQNQSDMLAVLVTSRDWTSAELDPIYAGFQFPGVNVDFDKVVNALRKHFLA